MVTQSESLHSIRMFSMIDASLVTFLRPVLHLRPNLRFISSIVIDSNEGGCRFFFEVD